MFLIIILIILIVVTNRSMGYGVPMALRLSLYASTMIGLPMLLGVYRRDQDYISHYVGAGINYYY